MDDDSGGYPVGPRKNEGGDVCTVYTVWLFRQAWVTLIANRRYQ